MTGAEITTGFHKYFGNDQKIELVDIYDTYSGALIYRYDKETDKYINELAIGYESPEGTWRYIGFDSVSENDEIVLYKAKVLFCHYSLQDDMAGYYKTFIDAEEKKNALEKITDIQNFNSTSDEEMEKRFVTYNDKLDTYIFKFKKNGDNLEFISYEKK